MKHFEKIKKKKTQRSPINRSLRKKTQYASSTISKPFFIISRRPMRKVTRFLLYITRYKRCNFYSACKILRRYFGKTRDSLRRSYRRDLYFHFIPSYLFYFPYLFLFLRFCIVCKSATFIYTQNAT